MAGGSAPARRISADRGSPPTGPAAARPVAAACALGIEIEDRRGRRGAHRLHQFHVAGELLAHRRRDLRQRLQGAGLARLLMVVQGLLRVLAGQQRSGLGFAVLANDADHDMPQLHLAGIHPGSRLLPEHGAVRAVRVAEQVDHARRVGTAIGDPGALLHLLPHFPASGAYTRRSSGSRLRSLPWASNRWPVSTCLPSGVRYSAMPWFWYSAA